MRTADPTSMSQKEEELMRFLWFKGPMTVAQLVTLYPEPRPHANTISTVVRRLEAKGMIDHTQKNGTYEYYAVMELHDFRTLAIQELVNHYFAGNYLRALSAIADVGGISRQNLQAVLNSGEL